MRKQPPRRANHHAAASHDAHDHDESDITTSTTLPDDDHHHHHHHYTRPLSSSNALTASTSQSTLPSRSGTRTPPMTRSRHRQKFTETYRPEDDGYGYEDEDGGGDGDGYEERSASPSAHASRMRFSRARARAQANNNNNSNNNNNNHSGAGAAGLQGSSASIDPINNDIFARTMLDLNEEGFTRERTPATSPNRKRQRVYGDRFIPNRSGQDLLASYNLLHDDASPSTPSTSKKRSTHTGVSHQRIEEANQTYSRILRNEVFGDEVPQPDMPNEIYADIARSHTPPHNLASLPPANLTPTTPSKSNLFSYSPRHNNTNNVLRSAQRSGLSTLSEMYSLSPIRMQSQLLLQNPRKAMRYVNKVPYKVLDAPDLVDNFYLNLIDWGSSNVLGVGLGSSVYMWDAVSESVTRLCQIPDDTVTSVNWIQRGTHLAIGTNKGFVQIWDAQACRRLRTMTGHTFRAGALAWNDHILTSGSRDRLILHRDVRSPDQYVRRLAGHKQEVCGLKWNPDDGQLASGGNDNNLFVWDKLSEAPLFRLSEHKAAVKALAWSPHQHHLLASGGGTADRRIKFWNTATGTSIKDIDTGNQVCNLAWSLNSDELVSTHGYSQNQIVIWKYPRMEEVVSLTGHTFRVQYLAMSPDGVSIVTGAGDETLRFWKVFNRKGSSDERNPRNLMTSAIIR